MGEKWVRLRVAARLVGLVGVLAGCGSSGTTSRTGQTNVSHLEGNFSETCASGVTGPHPMAPSIDSMPACQ